MQHNKAIYEGWRKVGLNNKRVYILTCSGFAGLQRYAAATWSGDINATQSVYVAQVPAGLSYAISSGMPYGTTDIGGYFGTPTEAGVTRWFQFGAFCPMFRIHGQAPKGALRLAGEPGGQGQHARRAAISVIALCRTSIRSPGRSRARATR